MGGPQGITRAPGLAPASGGVGRGSRTLGAPDELASVPYFVMFHSVRNMKNNGTWLWQVVTDGITRRLPRGWSVTSPGARSRKAGRVLEIEAPDRRSSRIVVLERQRAVPRDLPAAVSAAAKEGFPVLLVSPFLSARAREVLAELGASYADGTGNLRIALARPALFIESQGADRDPSREARPLRSLRGPAAGRVVRALCDFMPPYGVRTLTGASSTPLGTVSRVVGLLDQDAIVRRDDRKRIVSVNWEALLRRWTQDYDVKTSNRIHPFLEPRGLSALAEKLTRFGRRYALTGSMAGPGIAATRLAMIYVDDVTAAATDLELTATEAGANVWLLEPYDDVVFDRMDAAGFPGRDASRQGLLRVALSQVVADLMTSPGRGPQEAAALMEKMQGNEDGWRRRP